MERREHKRHPIANNTLIVHGRQVGTINDISKEGFCCTCIVDDKKVSTPQQVNIIQSKINLKAIGLPVEVHAIGHQFGLVLETMNVRTCHCEFQNLSETQQTKIDNLIHSHVNEIKYLYPS